MNVFEDCIYIWKRHSFITRNVEINISFCRKAASSNLESCYICVMDRLKFKAKVYFTRLLSIKSES